MNKSDAYKLIDDTELIFNKFGMDAEVYPTNRDEALEISKQIAKVGANLLLIKQKHLGSDMLPTYIINFTKYLKEHGVEILDKADCYDIVENNDKII